MKAPLVVLLILLAMLPRFAVARDAREQERIDFLLQTLETEKGIVFIRNAAEYDGAAAAKRLRGKLADVGERVKTAGEFVQYCASESSVTHRKYTVRLPDGTTMGSATYFAGLLRKFDHQKR